MTPTAEYLYDVAFSFCGQDESIAAAINDLLKDRWKTFVYFEHQKALVGKDGERMFNDVFGRQARLVVVLYRLEWGTTPFTRIEATAIRNRAMDEGYDFTVFVPVDEPPTSPPWLPKNRLWANLKRFGVQGAAAAIEARLEDAGAGSKPETIEQQAARLRREKQEDNERLAYLVTHGRERAAQEVVALFDAVERLISSSVGAGTPHDRDDPRHQACFHAGGLTLGVGWDPGPYANVIEDGELTITLWGATFRLRPAVYLKHPPKVKTTVYGFDVAPVRHVPIWRPERDGVPLSTNELAKLAVKELLDQIEKNQRSKQRR